MFKSYVSYPHQSQFNHISAERKCSEIMNIFSFALRYIHRCVEYRARDVSILQSVSLSLVLSFVLWAVLRDPHRKNADADVDADPGKISMRIRIHTLTEL
jgi:hypothetical protein